MGEVDAAVADVKQLVTHTESDVKGFKRRPLSRYSGGMTSLLIT